MGYYMVYGSAANQEKKHTVSGFRILLMTISFLTAFLLTVNRAWPTGRTVLQNLFLPGNATVSSQALSDLVTDLQDGNSVAEAVEAFCRSVLKEAENEHATGLSD